MPRKSRDFQKRSLAAKKGWVTRRRKGLHKGGKKGVSNVQKLKKQLAKADKEIAFLKKEKKKLLRKQKGLTKKERYRKKMMKRFEFLFTTDAYEVVFRTDGYQDAIRTAQNLNIHPDTIYMQFAEKFKRPPKEVYSNLMGSPPVDQIVA